MYGSVIPPVYPITEAVIIIAVYVTFSVIYGLHLKRVHPEIAENAGKGVNLVEEERLKGFITNSKRE